MMCTLICSLYAPKGDTDRVKSTVSWYDNITQTAGLNFSLCVVSDGSAESFDSIKEELVPKGFCKDVQYFESKENLGKAKQLNRLLVNIQTPFVCMIDNDVLLPPNWLTDCIRVASVPNVGVCGVLVEDHLELGVEHTQPTPQGNFSFHTPTMMGGACIVWNRHKLGEEGYLWSHDGSYGHEDCEFVQRIHRRVGMISAIPTRGSHRIPAKTDKVAQQYRQWKDEIMDEKMDMIKERMVELDAGNPLGVKKI